MHTEQDEINKLREVLDYNPDTGVFRWKCKRSNRAKGSIAGTVDTKGYGRLRVFNRNYAIHRVAFAFTYNRWPKPMCDHINGDPLDNRIANLREATHVNNTCNRRTPKNNKSGFKGVSWYKRNKRWVAIVKLNKKTYWCGHFKVAEEAAKAVALKRKELHGEFARD